MQGFLPQVGEGAFCSIWERKLQRILVKGEPATAKEGKNSDTYPKSTPCVYESVNPN
jgi:hypothetical protein